MMNYDQWWKEPLLLSIDSHRKQLQQFRQGIASSENSPLDHLEQKLNQLEEQIQNQWFDPLLLHQFQHRLARWQKRFLRLQEGSNPSTQQLQIAESETTGEKTSPQTDQIEHGQNPVSIGKHRLPPLPYPYNALEPYIDEKTMHLHHDEHHKAYVDGLNKAEIMLKRARQSGDYTLIKHWEREAAFHGAGHYLHTIFWEIMSPKGGGKPQGVLAKQIKRDFGSFEKFKEHFSHAAEKVEGGGWAVLVWSPRSHRLAILQAEKHQNLSQWDVIPLLCLDVWEHAYYLKYPNRRKKYIQNWWHIVYWPEVAKRFLNARKVVWKPY